MTSLSTDQTRAQFDFAITFSDGGGLDGTDFRLDLPAAEATQPEVAALLLRHLDLLLVENVTITNLRLIQEPHKGSRGGPSTPAGQLIDLSHPIEAGMVTYPGLPGPEITDHLTREASRSVYAAGTEFAIGRISMVANTGTYLDSPFHRYPAGADLAALDLTQLVDLAGVVVVPDPAARHAIGVEAFTGLDVLGRAVLVATGWDRLWRTEAYGDPDHPHLTEAACQWLVAQGAALVGIDSVNIDDTRGGGRPAHTMLLAAGIAVVEHLRGLDALPASGFTFTAVPPAVVGLGTFPVRAYATLR